MDKYIDRLSARMNALEKAMQELKHRGTISLESADEIERLIPGEMGELDSGLMFDVEESETGYSVAMEAGMANLANLKIAFIVAVIAFIGRYLLTLRNNAGTGFSAAGGGGGGWSGSAPPKYQTPHRSTDPKNWEDADNYFSAVDEDIDTLRKKFDELYEKFNAQVMANDIISGMSSDVNLRELAYVVIPRILKNNGLSQGGKFNFLTNGYVENYEPPLRTYQPLLEPKDKNNVGEDAVKILKMTLNQINKSYTTKAMFSYWSDVASKLNRESDLNKREALKSQLISFPYFVVDEEVKKDTIALCKVIIGAVEKSQDYSSTLSQIKVIIDRTRNESPDTHEGLNFAKPLWEWLAANLATQSPNPTFINNYIKELTPVIDLKNETGKADTVYFNTMMRANQLKRLVALSIKGVESSGVSNLTHKGLANSVTFDKQMMEIVSSMSKGELKQVLSGIDPIREISEALKDHSGDINSLTEQAEELEKIIGTVAEAIREEAKENDGNRVDTRLMETTEKVKLTDLDGNVLDNPAAVRKNLPHMFSLISGLIQILLLSVSAGAKYNLEMDKFIKEHCKFVISKAQEMATDYNDLNTLLENIINKA